jgi:L-threonylcarbamoyladenylate synthase
MSTRPIVEKVDALHPEHAIIKQAARILRKRGLVAFPTETVYGLGALGLDAKAVARIYEAKGRPAWNPVIQHVANAKAASRLVHKWTRDAEALATAFWPGPLTIVLRKSEKVPDIATAGLDAVAIRVPSHRVALDLLREVDEPIAAPSANRFTQLSPTTAAHVRESLGDRVDMIIDGGPCAVGIESTVVDLTGSAPIILRPGMVSRTQIEQVLGRAVVIQDSRLDISSDVHSAARSPGMSVRHYAPRSDVWLVHPSDRADVREALPEMVSRGRVVALVIDSTFATGVQLPPESLIINMPQEPAGYAQRIYAALHEADHTDTSVILIEQPPETPEWHAIRDRLTRAAAIP